MRISWFRIILVTVLVVLLTVMPLAQAYAVQPRYAYTAVVAAGLSISSGSAHCFGEIGVYDSSNTVSMKVRLWHKVDGVWSVIKTWSKTTTGDNMCTIDKYYSVAAGTYKVTVAGTITTPDGGRENVSCTSNTRTYP